MCFVHSSSVPFFIKVATSLSFTFCRFFHDRYFRGMTVFLPTHCRNPHNHLTQMQMTKFQ